MSDLPEDTYQPPIPIRAANAVLMLMANGVEGLEFFYPYYHFIEEGFKVDVAHPPQAENSRGSTGLA